MKEKYEKLERHYNTVVEATQRLELENKKLSSEIALLQAKLESANKDVLINKNIVMQTITIQNEEKESFAEEIRLLKAKIRELEK